MRIFILLLFLFFVIQLKAQSGCTDPQASNYDRLAQENDGSCRYPNTSYQLNLLGDLPSVLAESSGLATDQGKLYTINDAGNPATFFEIDTLDGSIIKSHHFRNASNIDWEDLGQDELYFYIGDFGNNEGSRRDLRIFRFPKTALAEDSISVDTIAFNFPDQVDFSPGRNNHDFDCEAFFVHDDSIFLFSKNWIDRKTRLYAFPTQPGEYTAILKDSFNVNGLVTAADIDEEGVVTLLGYTELSTFLWVLFDYPANHFFKGNKRPISLGTPLNNAQTEGIVFMESGSGFVSAERLNVFGVIISERISTFTTKQWIENVIVSLNNPEVLGYDIYPNPFTEKIIISRDVNTEEVDLQLIDGVGKLYKITTIDDYQKEISTIDLPPGVYYLVLKGEGWISRALLLRSRM